jgi:hypothetical protein
MGIFEWLFGKKGTEIPLQINGEVVGTLTVTSDRYMSANGKRYKLIWVPDQVINLIEEK